MSVVLLFLYIKRIVIQDWFSFSKIHLLTQNYSKQLTGSLTVIRNIKYSHTISNVGWRNFCHKPLQWYRISISWYQLNSGFMYPTIMTVNQQSYQSSFIQLFKSRQDFLIIANTDNHSKLQQYYLDLLTVEVERH